MSFFHSLRYSKLVLTLRDLIPDDMVNIAKHLPTAVLANVVYGFPSRKLKVIGVTGTNGKTTTTTMLYHLLHKAGYKVAMISTVNAKIGEEELDTGFHVTSPDHFPLQKLFKHISEKGYEYVILESTSQGLAQYRVWGVNFLMGIITNITEDHLLYHKTMEKYAAAKAKLFHNVKFSILNCEDEWFEFVKKRASGKIVTYGLEKGDWNLKNFHFQLLQIGKFNQLNALAAAAGAFHLGLTKTQIQDGLKTFRGVLGRMEIMQTKPFTVIVDFAHTPDSLEKALLAIHDLQKEKKLEGRIISVFGCAGWRDVGRRKMGAFSAKLADITIITAEDPRTESVEKISNEIAAYAQQEGGEEVSSKAIEEGEKLPKSAYTKIADREMAVKFALKIAKEGDIIGIFGKGHERSMAYGLEEFPWSDQEAVEKYLQTNSKK